MLSSLVKRPFLLSSHTDSHPKTQLQAAPLNPQAGPKWLPWEPIPRFTRLCPHATLWYWNQPWSSPLGFMSVLPTPKIFPGQVFSKCSPELNNWMKFPSWALWFNFFHLGGRGGGEEKDCCSLIYQRDSKLWVCPALTHGNLSQQCFSELRGAQWYSHWRSHKFRLKEMQEHGRHA